MIWLAWILAVVCCQASASEEDDEILPCLTPNRETAYCVPLYWCPNLLQDLASLKDPAVEFYRYSKCGDSKVCCGRWTRYNTFNYITGSQDDPRGDYEMPTKLNETIVSNRNYVLENLIPDKRYCGFQHTDDRFHDGNSTALDEIPWLVIFNVSYHKISSSQMYHIQCAGVIITERHILTSVFCSQKRVIVNSVIIGLYDRTKNQSCNEDPFLPECTEPAVQIPVKNFAEIGDSNLVLFVLEKKILYTDFVRPICLPHLLTARPTAGQEMTTSSWANESKQRITNVLLPDEECSRIQMSVAKGTINKKYAMCTKAENNLDYPWDNGGPFTYKYKHQWFLEGIINGRYSENSNPYLIGEKITPDILNWILDAVYYFHKLS